MAKAGGELQALVAQVRACEACDRAAEARVFGSGYPRAPVMLVASRPSADDLQSGAAFVAEAEPLGKAFEALGVPRSWIYGTSAVRCGSADPIGEELRACATHLLVEIEAVRPRVLVAFGAAAFRAVCSLDGRCGIAVPPDPGGSSPVRIRPDLVLLVTEDLPAGVRDKDAKRRLWRDLQALPKLLA